MGRLEGEQSIRERAYVDHMTARDREIELQEITWKEREVKSSAASSSESFLPLLLDLDLERDPNAGSGGGGGGGLQVEYTREIERLSQHDPEETVCLRAELETVKRLTTTNN